MSDAEPAAALMPTHITTHTTVTHTWTCNYPNCRARIHQHDGDYDHPDRAGQVLAEWVARHMHEAKP